METRGLEVKNQITDTKKPLILSTGSGLLNLISEAIMTHKIRLDNDADNEASSKNGHAYILIGDKQVHFTYDADYNECGERDEYWGGQLAVSGSSWIEVNSVTNLNIVEILDSDENELPLDSYTMTADDKLQIIEVIKDFIEGNIEASQPANSYYYA